MNALWCCSVVLLMVGACDNGGLYLFENISQATGASAIQKDCSGTRWENGCDDCNPCTWDPHCDPVSGGPIVAPWCEGIALPTCLHEPYSTDPGQINDCFPISETDVRPGKCCAGQCIDNAFECLAIDGPAQR